MCYLDVRHVVVVVLAAIRCSVSTNPHTADILTLVYLELVVR